MRRARRSFRVVVPLAVLLLAGTAAAGEAPPVDLATAAPLDLEAAVAVALARNPGLKAIEERRGELAAGVSEARADAFPQLAASASWSQSRNPSLLNSPDFEEFLENFPGGTFEPRVQELYSLGVELTQPLYTWGKVGAAIALAKTAVGVVEAQVETARLDTALAAAEAYYEVLSTRRSLAVVEIQERLRRESLAVVEARYEIGEATRLELLRAEAALAEVTPQVEELRGDVAVAAGRLRSVLGVPPETPVDVAPRDEERGEELAPAPELDALLDLARRGRPELADLELQRKALGEQKEVTLAEGRPQLELAGFYGREARLPDNLSDPLFENWRFSLGLRWEFFDGGRRRGQAAQLESQRRQLAWQLEDLLNQIRLELEQSRAAYRSARARWQAAELSAAAAREASRVAAESYREGVALQTDLLDAQRQETEAEIVRVEAFYDALTESARLLRALGRLPTAGWEAAEATSGARTQEP